MADKKKDSQILVRTTREQNDFLHEQALKEDRTITAIVNIALGKQYPEYKDITRKGND